MPLRQLQLHCSVCSEMRPHLQEQPNHLLHGVLTFLTGGLWAIPWLAFAAQEKPAVCAKCGAQRSARNQLLLTSGAAPHTTREIEDAVDAALRKVKGPLRTCRSKHGIIGDVTFRLRYEPSGTIAGVTIDNGPPNITPGFIQDSMTIIKGMLVLPQSFNGGVMLFTDKDSDSGEPYR